MLVSQVVKTQLLSISVSSCEEDSEYFSQQKILLKVYMYML